MKKLSIILALVLLSTTAHATLAPPIWFKPPPKYVKVVKPIVGSGSGGGNQSLHCFINPAAVFICITAGMIIVDEVKRTWFEGLPGCATRKQRQSWFGPVSDEPKLWRPLCSWRNRQG